MTTIVVLRASNIGATLARKWVSAGHRVTLASRNPDAPALRDLAAGVGATTGTHADPKTMAAPATTRWRGCSGWTVALAGRAHRHAP